MSESKDIINEIVGVKESFELPQKLLAKLLNAEERPKMFERFLAHNSDLSYDWFTDYFQEEHSNREKMMQDFTPKELAELVNTITYRRGNVIDVCSGTGGLTIKAIDSGASYFKCQELSKRAIPILLFNLSIRNINGQVDEIDILTLKKSNTYKLTKGERFSDITQESGEEIKYDKCITNPPYSLSCKEINKNDVRFEGYGLPPSSKNDFGFILHGLYNLKDDGELLAILPHGVLFRGAQEKTIRERLVENNFLDAVIGLPNKLFLNTSIPVCIMILKKQRETKDVMFIDASNGFEKLGKINKLRREDIDKIVNTYRDRKDVEKYARVVEISEIEENEYNLNIPRYVDTTEEEQLQPLSELLEEMIIINDEIAETESKVLDAMINDMAGFSPEEIKKLKKLRKQTGAKQKEKQLDWSDVFV